MGSKTQAGTKETRAALRCKECKRDFLTIAAIKSHNLARHSVKSEETQPNKPEKKDEKKTAFVPPTSRVSKRLQQKKSTDSKEIEEDEKIDNVSIQSKRKTVFQCPKCEMQFRAYFSAIKHIQKRHCEDKDGNPVEPNSTNMIRPISKEVTVKSDISVTKLQNQDTGFYSCLACKRVFEDVATFDSHVEASHKDSLSTFVMSSMIEFNTWKSNIEAKQKLKYLSLSNAAQKQYYQCNYVSPQNSASVTHLCPSMLIIREIPKGIKINFHKDHFEHVCETVPIPNDVSNLEDNSHSSEFERSLKKGDDVFAKIKRILETVISKASSMKKKDLKSIYLLSLKMDKCLDNIESSKGSQKLGVNELAFENDSIPSDDNRDDLEESASKSMTDDQITKALEGPRTSTRLKRKSEGSPTPEVKNKVKKSGLKENNSLSKDLNGLRSPRSNIASPFSQSPSFNDSYKQFIEVNSPKAESEVPTIKHTNKTEEESPPLKRVKKEVVKTKIGQFSPKKNLTKSDTENELSKNKLKGPAKGRTSLENVKLEEVDFEVVEQENDCNILILKI